MVLVFILCFSLSCETAATGAQALLCSGTVHFHSLNSIVAMMIENKRKDYQKCYCAVLYSEVVDRHKRTRD